MLNTESFQENSKHQIARFNRHKKDECSRCKESEVVVLENIMFMRSFPGFSRAVREFLSFVTDSAQHPVACIEHWKPSIENQTLHQAPFQLLEYQWWEGKGLGTLSKKKNDIIWEFFPNVGPPPHPPLLGTPYPKKIFSVYFAF